MALDALGNDPCSKLNVTSYPDLWIQPNASESETYPRIAKNGLPISMMTMLKGKSLTGDVLARREPNNSYRLIQFLSGGGIAGSSYGSLQSVLLGSDTIVDSYFTNIKSNYLTSYGSMLSKGDMTKIVQALQTKGYLLKESDIYIPAQLATLPTPPAVASQSLIYLYKAEQTTPLTPDQKNSQRNVGSNKLTILWCFFG